MAARETLAHRDAAALQEGALPEQVLDSRNELQRVERLLEKGVGAGRERLVTRFERGNRQAGTDSGFLQAPAQLGARSAGEEQFDHGELRQVLLELARCVVGIEGENDLVALGLKEELSELCRVRIPLGEQDQEARRRLAVIRGAEVDTALEPLAEQAVRLSRLQALDRVAP